MNLTIGLPIYNAEEYVGDAIRSIQNQTMSDWTCIIIDDGSQDGSLEIVQNLIKKDPKFTLIADGHNRGLPSRLNEIASLCKTRYLARMDSDDIMLPHRIALQLEVLQTRKTVDVVGSDAYIIDVDNKIHGVRRGQVKFDIQNALHHSLFIHPTIMGRTEWFKANPYDIERKRSEDYELWLRTVKFSNFFKIEEPLLFYREVGLKHANKYDKYCFVTVTRLA